jgi:hypothetical protein
MIDIVLLDTLVWVNWGISPQERRFIRWSLRSHSEEGIEESNFLTRRSDHIETLLPWFEHPFLGENPKPPGSLRSSVLAQANSVMVAFRDIGRVSYRRPGHILRTIEKLSVITNLVL